MADDMMIKQRFVLGAAPAVTTTGVDIAADNISATNVTTTNLAATTISVSNTITGTQYVFADQFPGATAGDKINAAIASLILPGGTVDATGLTGAQTIGTTILMNKSMRLIVGGTTFSGSVNPLIEISASNCVITSSSSKLAFFNQTLPPGNGIKIDAGANHVLIENIAVQNTAPLPPLPGNFDQQNTPMWAIGTSVQSVEDLTVRNCWIGNGTTQMTLEWCNNSHIVNNQFVATAPESPRGGGNPGIVECLVLAGAHNVIDGNSFTTTGNVAIIIYFTEPAQNVPVFPGSNYNRITNNVLTALTPINNWGIAGFGSYNTIGSNALKLASVVATNGILLLMSANVGVLEKATYNNIIGNTIDIADGNFSNPGSGISLQSTDVRGMDYNVISGNTVSCPGPPLTIQSGSHNVVSGNTFFVTGGSVGINAVTMASDSSSTAPTEGNIIIGNTVTNSTSIGIFLHFFSSGSYVEGNRIIGNPSVAGYGIWVSSTSGPNAYVGGNFFSVNLNYGIYVDPGAGANVSVGMNHFVAADIHTAAVNIAGVTNPVQPTTSGPIRIASNNVAGKGITISNGVTADHTWIFPDQSDQFVGQQTTDTLSNKTLNYPVINTGIQQGSGLKAIRVVSASIAPQTLLGVAVTWPTAFPSDQYTVTATVGDATGSGSVVVRDTYNQSATGITVFLYNNSTTTSIAGLLHVIAIHD